MAPGCNTTRTPIKPERVPIQRGVVTFSPKKSRARISVKSGMVKFSVVTTAIGAIESPWQYRAMPPHKRAERAMCKGMRSVLNVDMPPLSMNGSMVSVAPAKRRKTTCQSPRLWPTAFMMTSFVTPMNWWARNQTTPTKKREGAGDFGCGAGSASAAAAAATQPRRRFDFSAPACGALARKTSCDTSGACVTDARVTTPLFIAEVAALGAVETRGKRLKLPPP
mmetsp:Transcript_16520/g.53911  ORF Transcript_16520/g.53911 Transcript_16520/m.53911 type:complete len:223 (+) Transcript_16520:519-1187(+)